MPTRALTSFLVAVSKNGRYALAIALLTGIMVPQLADIIKPHLGAIVFAILFINAYRIGWRALLVTSAELKRSVAAIFAAQLILPVGLACGFLVFGIEGGIATALVLLVSAPTITGTPNIVALCGYNNAPALRLLILGTLFLPLSVSCVFFFLPDDMSEAGIAWIALRVSLIVFTTCGIGFGLRMLFPVRSRERQGDVLDGAALVLMFTLVVGLMASFGPALANDPSYLLTVLAFTFLVCFGLQASTFWCLGNRIASDERVSLSVAAGCRNMALFIAALPSQIMESLLLFIACYQIPMFLTPLIAKRFYRASQAE